MIIKAELKTMSDQEFQFLVLQRLDQIEERFDKIDSRFEKVENRLDHLKSNLEKFNDKFSNYQQSVQWVVQLAFTLIASATITIIISSVLRR